VVRACRPPSAKISTAASEAPFITCACWVNSAVQAMKPPRRTTRRTRSRSPPQAARSWATRLRKLARAASFPCSMETPAVPSLPAATSLPPRSGNCPEITTSVPVTA
jgi:hypothetical protein